MTTVRNRLASETSPYLLQHADNPVDWFPWGEEALAKSRAEDKPILLSIGYSACHWCHVMAHESFEDDETAALMNQRFVNVKVDREERPDVDDVYMGAVQAMTRRGGWPLTVFLTPALEPYFGGTYFPPDSRFGMLAFREVLRSCADYYAERREEATTRASSLVGLLAAPARQHGLAALEAREGDTRLDVEKIAGALQPIHRKAVERLEAEADRERGGFGRAPKFPQPAKIELLLWDEKPANVAHAVHTLDRIRAGGITDQIGLGVARYSVDDDWRVPHFEKMLYDNAQLLPLFAHGAAAVATYNPSLSGRLAEAARGIAAYLERDMRDEASGLYFCAEDADSEGEEGRFYVFTDAEFDEAFAGENPATRDFAKRWFGVTRKGNFEGSNVLVAPVEPEVFAAREGRSLSEARVEAEACRARLDTYRARRERPGKDTKCLLGWNALLATGLLRAGAFLADEVLARRGLALVHACSRHFRAADGWRHTYSKGDAKIPAFADDLAFHLEACVEALFLTGLSAFRDEALALAKALHAGFVDPSEGILYYAPRSPTLPVRPHKPEDDVVPSAHSAVIGACERLRTWAGAQGDGTLEPSQLKMLEALSLVALANVASFAREFPVACAKSLLWVKWLSTRATVLVAAAGGSPEDAMPSFTAWGVPSRAHAASRRGMVCCVVPFSGTGVAPGMPGATMEGPVTFAYCDVTGCRLPSESYE